MHLDPSDPESVETSSPRIASIRDKGFYGYDAAQETESLRPYWLDFQGKKWIDFSLGGHYLNVIAEPPLPEGRTVFAIVYLPYSEHTGLRRCIIEQYPDYFALSTEIHADNVTRAVINDGGAQQVQGDPPPLERSYLQVMRWKTAENLRVYQDLKDYEGTTDIGSVVLGGQTGWRIGTYRDVNDRWFDGYMGELIVYDRALTDSEREDVANYLMNKWDIVS